MKSTFILALLLCLFIGVTASPSDSIYFKIAGHKTPFNIAFERTEFNELISHFKFNELLHDQLFNALDASGMKHGFWVVMIDKNFQITKKAKHCKWFYIEPYWHGQRIGPRFEESYFDVNANCSKLTTTYPALLNGKITYLRKGRVICQQNLRHGFLSDTLKNYRKDFSLAYMYVTNLTDSINFFEVYQLQTECGTWGTVGNCILQGEKLIIVPKNDKYVPESRMIILAEQTGVNLPHVLAETVIEDSLLVRFLIDEYIELDVPKNFISVRLQNDLIEHVVPKNARLAIVLVLKGKKLIGVKTIEFSEAEKIIRTSRLTRKTCENYIGNYLIPND